MALRLPPVVISRYMAQGGVENHAVIAMIARAFIGQNPFEVWGDGTQIRNWTYIDDYGNGIGGDPGYIEGTLMATAVPEPASVSTSFSIMPLDANRRNTCLRPGHVALPSDFLRLGSPAYSCSL